MPESDAHREVLLAEYKTLRDELIKKMDHRTSFRIAALTLTLGATGIGVERRSSALLFLIPVAVVLFSNYAAFHTQQIRRLSRYIKERIEKPLAAAYPGSIGWHSAADDRRARFRETFLSYHLPNLMMAVAPSLLGLALGWSYPGALWFKLMMTAVDLVLLGLYLMNYVGQHNEKLSGGSSSPSLPAFWWNF